MRLVRASFTLPRGGVGANKPTESWGPGGNQSWAWALPLGPCGRDPRLATGRPARARRWSGEAGTQIADGGGTWTRRSLPVQTPSRAILEFASSRRAEPLLPQLIPQPCASRDGRQHGEQDQGARARPAFASRCLGYNPPWSRRQHMLAEERRCKRRPGAASMQRLMQRFQTAVPPYARHCRQLCQSLRALKSCVPLTPSQPHSPRVMPERV